MLKSKLLAGCAVLTFTLSGCGNILEVKARQDANQTVTKQDIETARDADLADIQANNVTTVAGVSGNLTAKGQEMMTFWVLAMAMMLLAHAPAGNGGYHPPA